MFAKLVQAAARVRSDNMCTERSVKSGAADDQSDPARMFWGPPWGLGENC